MTNQTKLILLVMLCGANGSAKPSLFPDSTQYLCIDDIEQSTPWLRSNNAAGLTTLPQSISEAKAFLQKDNGKFVNVSESDNSITWGAKAASFMRLNARTVLSGVIEYNHFSGKHMGGSFFMDPERMPFDIVDYDTNNKGKKRLETYHLNGAVSYDITPHWTLGAKIDYTAGNYAKEKDLRHTNELMDIRTTAGVLFTTKRWDIGVNYLFHKRNEGIAFETFGTTEETYNTLISYGGFWGVVEQFGVIGYTDKNEQKPLIDKYHGIGLQLNWKPTKNISIYNELEYTSRKGSYGIPATRKITYTNHDGNELGYSGQFSLFGKRVNHHLQWAYHRESLNNDENIYRFEPGPGGLDEIKYFGSLETLKKKTHHLDVQYIGYFGRKPQHPTWTLRGGYHFFAKDVKATFYPFYRKQDLHNSTIHLSGEYHLNKEYDRFSFLLVTQLTIGDGTLANDGSYIPPGSNQKPPKNSPVYLNHEFEYLTATQMQHQAGVQYMRTIKNSKVAINGGIRYEFAHAFDTQFIKEAHHHSLMLHVGCKF